MDHSSDDPPTAPPGRLNDAIPQIGEGQRLYVVEGRPWRKALQWLVDGDLDGTRPWHGAKDYRDGDVLLTVLSTDPRMVMCLDVTAGDAAAHPGRIRVRNAETIFFRHGISFDALKAMAEINIQLYRYYQGADAQKILNALGYEYHLDTPWFTPERWLNTHGIIW